ncbi:MAG: DUF4431 domain-containing protein [Tannerella sp.]|jgi:hypothetical protein|nr:DUF4431 domain-containing protein [Tannerella sp.]
MNKAVLTIITLAWLGSAAYSQNFSGTYDWKDTDNDESFTLVLKQSGNKITGGHRASDMLGRESYTNSISGTVSSGVAYLVCYSGDCTLKTTVKQLSNGQIEWKVTGVTGQGEYYVPQKAIMKKKQSGSSNKKNYYYEPKMSEISGAVKMETFYGPPGYGENPATDRKEAYGILYLNSPINVIATKEDMEEGVNTHKYNVSRIQLVSTTGIKFSRFQNKKVHIIGTFSGAITGHHHTSVLMHVIKISEIK